MSGFSTRWVVREEHPIGAADVDADGVVRRDAIERWITGVCTAYLDQCAALQRLRDEGGLALVLRITDPQSVDRLGPAETVVVTASATELRPTDFTMSIRLRATADGPVNATCLISVEDPATGELCELGDDVRDEVIALEHTASHFN